MINHTLFIQCLFYYFKIFGCGAMSLDIIVTKNSPDAHLSLKRSKWGVSYNIFLSLLMIISHAISLRKASKNGSKFDFVRMTTLAVINLSTALFIMITAGVHQEKLIEIANKINTTGKSLMSNSRMCFKKYGALYEIRKALCTIFVFWFLTMATRPVKTIQHFLFVFSLYACDLVTITFVIQYSILLKLTQHLFKILNDNLLEISKDPVCSFVTEFIQTDMELSKLRKLHKTLNDISRDISDFYGQPMIFCTTTFFTMFIYITHVVIKYIIIFAKSDSLPPTQKFIHFLAYGFTWFMTLAILTTSATATMSEVMPNITLIFKRSF